MGEDNLARNRQTQPHARLRKVAPIETLEDTLTVEDDAGMGQQHLQDGEFLRSQPYQFYAYAHFAPFRVQSQVAAT